MDCDVFLCWWCGFAVKYPAQLISQLGGLSTVQREVSEVMGVLCLFSGTHMVPENGLGHFQARCCQHH